MSETTLRPGANPNEDPPTTTGVVKSRSSVIVIGAGMSGLCASRALNNANANFTNVTLLEARSHIGGDLLFVSHSQFFSWYGMIGTIHHSPKKEISRRHIMGMAISFYSLRGSTFEPIQQPSLHHH